MLELRRTRERERERERYNPAGLAYLNLVLGCFAFNPWSVAFGASTCGDGYVSKSFSGILMPVDGECMAGQNQINWPDVQSQIIRSSALRCGAGYYNNGTKCVAYPTKSCPESKYDFSSGGILMPVDGDCMSGQSQVNWPNIQSNVIKSPVLRCGAGYYNNGTKCVAYSVGDCPTNYYSGDRYNSWGTTDSENLCATDFSDYDDVEWCKYLGGNTDHVCSPLCPDGLTHTRADTCANACSIAGKTKIVLGGRIRVPMWDVKTPHALGVRADEDKCWINLVPGRGTNAIHIKDSDGTIYHTVN